MDRPVILMAPGNFTQELQRLNNYPAGWLRNWLFRPGMKFGDPQKWWDPGTNRPRPHEGLDLLTFQDETGREQQLLPGTKTPPILSGAVVARLPDFRGETVVLAHDFLDNAGRRLHTFYAHLEPTGSPASGSILAPGVACGTITAPGKTSRHCPPHLHISLAWVDKLYPIQVFRWEDFADSETFRPGDPLALISKISI